MRKKITMLMTLLLCCAGVVKAQYYVIESIGNNITNLSSLTEGSYVALYNVGKQKYIHEGVHDHKLYMGTDATEGAGHGYIWQVHLEEGGKYSFSAASGYYFSTPLDGKDIYAVPVDDDSKDEFTIKSHYQASEKWQVMSTNNTSDGGKYWDAQNDRFVGWQGKGTNSQYEIRPITVKESEHALADLITLNEDNIKWLHIKNIRCGKYATYTGESSKMALTDASIPTTKTLFYLTGTPGDITTVKIHNYATESLCNENESWTANGREWYIQSSEGLQGNVSKHPGWAISKNTDLSKNEAWNNESGKGNFIAYWNGNDLGSTWEFVSADYDDIMSNLQTLKDNLASAITDAESKITEAEYTSTAVTLSATEGQAGYLYCNAPYTADPNSVDAKGVAALIDNNPETYLHTDYSGADSKDGEDHYIRVDLGDGNALSYFTFNYQARHNNKNNNPTVMVIEGSNDNNTYEEIETLTGLPTTQAATYQSGVIGNGKAYRYLRFKVTETSGGASKGGHKFFTMASFALNKVTVKSDMEPKTKVYASLINAIAAAKAVNENTATTEDDINDAIDMLAFIVDGLTIRTYPFTLTTDANNPVCYHIKSGRSDANNSYYFTLEDSRIKLIINADKQKDVETYWYFMEDPANGQLMIIPYVDADKPMGYRATTEGDNKLTNDPDDVVGYYYTVVESENTVYPHALKPYGSNYYISNYGGSDNYMGIYSVLDDDGSRLAFEAATITPSATIRDLRTAIANAQAKTPVAGTGLNQYTQASVEAYTAIITTAQGEYDDATQESSVYEEQIGYLSDAISVPVINQPQQGKFYRFKSRNNSRFLSSDLCSQGYNQMKMVDEASASTIFYLSPENHLISYHQDATNTPQGGCYVSGMKYCNQINNKSNVTFACASIKNGGEYGYYTLADGTTYMNDYSAETDADWCGSGAYAASAQWTIEEVTTLPVTISAAGYATLYAPVALTIPEGVTAYSAKVNGNVLILTEVETTIPAGEGVILEAEANTYNFTVTTTTATLDNDLTGTFAKTYVGDVSYVLAKKDDVVGFYKAKLNKNSEGNSVAENGTHFLNNAFKAYLPGTKVTTDAQALSFSFGRDNEGTTAIDNALLNNDKVVIYDLTGRRVERMEKGIYIVNGRKVVIK